MHMRLGASAAETLLLPLRLPPVRARLLPVRPLPDLLSATSAPPHLPGWPAGILRNIDHAGVSVMEALEQAGFDPSPASLRKMIIPKDKVGGSGRGQWQGLLGKDCGGHAPLAVCLPHHLPRPAHQLLITYSTLPLPAPPPASPCPCPCLPACGPLHRSRRTWRCTWSRGRCCRARGARWGRWPPSRGRRGCRRRSGGSRCVGGRVGGWVDGGALGGGSRHSD